MDGKSSKQVMCALLRSFFDKGWCSGSGGGISIRESDDCVYVAPSGVMKEYVQENEIYKMNIKGEIIEAPQTTKKLIPSDCTPLFNEIYKQRRAGAAIHSHSLNCCLVTKIFDTEVQAIDFEMIKGIKGHKNTEFCVVPIIENTEVEHELTSRLSNALIAYPRAQGVLVRNHGFYVFGDNWERAKITAECYDYLFAALLEMKKLGISPKSKSQASRAIRAWYVDEEAQKLDEQNNTFDLRNPYQKRQYDWVSAEYLKKLNIHYWPLDGEENNEILKNIRTEREYCSSDIVNIGDSSPNYQELLNKFKCEHIHYDEEIRYILEGSGFFDVRSHDDKWIRIHVVKGDMIVIPEGIYHRFSTDHCNFIKAMRLFKEEPKWTPYARPDESSESRKQYLQYLSTQKFDEQS